MENQSKRNYSCDSTSFNNAQKQEFNTSKDKIMKPSLNKTTFENRNIGNFLNKNLKGGKNHFDSCSQKSSNFNTEFEVGGGLNNPVNVNLNHLPSDTDVPFNISFTATQDYLNNLNEKSNQIANRIQEVNYIKQQNQNKDTSIKELETEVVQLREKLKIFLIKNQELEQKESANKEKIVSMNLKHEKLLKENLSLKNQIQQMELGIKNSNFEIDKQNEKEQILQNKISLMEKEINNYLEEIEEIKAKSIEVEEELKEKIKKIHLDCKEEIEKLSRSHNDELINLNKQLDSKNEEYLILQNEAHKLKLDLDKKEQYSKSNQEHSSNQLSYKEERIALLEEKLDNKTNELNTLTDKYNDLNRDYETKTKAYKQNIFSLEQERNKLLKLVNNSEGGKDINTKINRILECKDIKEPLTKFLGNTNQNNVNKSFINQFTVQSPILEQNQQPLSNSMFVEGIGKSGSPQGNLRTQKEQNNSYLNQFLKQNNLNNSYSGQKNKEDVLLNTSIVNASYAEKDKIKSLESEVAYWKKVCMELQNEISLINNKYKSDNQNLEKKNLNLIHSYEEKVEEIVFLKKTLTKLDKELQRKEEIIKSMDGKMKSTQSNFLNEIANKNEELFRLKNACDKIITKVHQNMEKALYMN